MTDEQWAAIETNDAAYDGLFVYGLRTTRIVCRPSCPARACARENVEIFPGVQEAMLAGYRPCLRCHPEKADWKGARHELAEKARQYIEAHYTEKFSLDAIAGSLFVNKSYLCRAFRDSFGCTMLTWQNTYRCRMARRLMETTDLSVTAIAYEVGFASSAHFSRIFR